MEERRGRGQPEETESERERQTVEEEEDEARKKEKEQKRRERVMEVKMQPAVVTHTPVFSLNVIVYTAKSIWTSWYICQI